MARANLMDGLNLMDEPGDGGRAAGRRAGLRTTGDPDVAPGAVRSSWGDSASRAGLLSDWARLSIVEASRRAGAHGLALGFQVFKPLDFAIKPLISV